MEYRDILIQEKEQKVSLLGFGLMRLPTKDRKINKPLVKQMIKKAIDGGINYFDTAYPYHNGDSELIAGELLSEYPRDSFYLANKLPLWECETGEDVTRIFHEQLRKCQTSYFDFYLIHAVNKNRLKQTKELNVINILEQLRQEGKIRNIGFSFHDDLETFKEWVELYDWDFVQIQLNYMDIDHQQGIEGYHILTNKKIPVIVMEPVKGGSLASFNTAVEEKMKQSNPESSIASWAFRWVGSLPNVRVILSGMSNMEQLEDNLHTFNKFEPLKEEEHKIIEKVREELLSLSKVSCTSCNYCMPCPHGVDIPGNFKIYNHHSMYQSVKYASWAIGNLTKKQAFADMCVQCGECLPKCPQNIDIPTRLSDFEEYVEKYELK